MDKKKIHLDKDDYNLLVAILSQVPVNFYVYGSRAKGTNRSFSDLDLCYTEPIDQDTLYKIKDDLVESDLPFKVDLTDYNKCSKEFKKLITKDMISL